MKSVPGALLRRRAASHKGDYGHLLIVAGAVGMTGAPVLCATAALRSGAGLVTLAVPKSVYPIVARTAPPEVMVHPVTDQKGKMTAAAFRNLAPLLERASILAIGPGLSRTAGTRALVRKLLRQTRQPVVLDADGIWALKGLRGLDRPRGAGEVVITPHPGEMGRLLGVSTAAVQKDRPAAALRAAKRFGVIALLKGHRTVIADSTGKVRINRSGNPGMATAGMGDALTGIIAALVGQELPSFTAAAVGAHFHGVAGDLAAKTIGQAGLTASDLIERIPEVFRRAARKQNLLA